MKTLRFLFFLCLCAATGEAFSATFGSGANEFEIEFVPVGQPGNPFDPDGAPFHAGSVGYSYGISKYEITEAAIDNANAIAGLGITHDGRGADYPATSISWFEAARLVNWLNTSSGWSPAYKFDSAGDFQLWSPSDVGYDPSNRFRNRHARYVLPSSNEWYKAAYYDPVAGVYYDYPTGSDTPPDGIDFTGDTEFEAVYSDGGTSAGPMSVLNSGIASPYGTVAQGGNVHEWLEGTSNMVHVTPTGSRLIRGGYYNYPIGLRSSYLRSGQPPFSEIAHVGFRVAVVPEPFSASLLWILSLMVGVSRWDFIRH